MMMRLKHLDISHAEQTTIVNCKIQEINSKKFLKGLGNRAKLCRVGYGTGEVREKSDTEILSLER